MKVKLKANEKMEEYFYMRIAFLPGKKANLVVLLVLLFAGLIASNLQAANKQLAENPLLRGQGLGKVASPAEELTCNVGMIANRIGNTTYEKSTGTNDWTIIIGDDALELPSMNWKTPAVYDIPPGNSYLYYASLRIGSTGRMTHLSSDRATPITTRSNATDSTAVSLLDTHFSIDDQSSTVPDALKMNIRVHQNTYAWAESYRDDFIIYDYWIVNLSAVDSLTPFYVALHADCDISTAEGGSDAQAYSRDDLVNYVRNDITGEYISYMFDGDNPTVPGNDIGGNKTPKESAGFIGSRLLYCPPVIGQAVNSRQTGHGWWDWNSDPSGDVEYYDRISDTTWLAQPPSPHDYRFLQKLGPFSIRANDSIRVVFAFGIGEGLAGLRTNLAWADYLFKNNWVGPSAPPSPTFTLMPGDRQVTIEWGNSPESVPDPVSGLIDFEGYRVWRRASTGSWELLLDCDIVDEVGPNTGLVHSFVDYSVSNGFQYTYAITSYDKGDPANGIESLESGKGTTKLVEPGTYSYTSGSAQTGIHVVPNPFVVRSAPGFGFQPDNNNPATERISFVNLPNNATVKIYSLTGDLLTTLRTARNSDATLGWQRTASWDIITDNVQTIVAGLYLYVVSAPGQSDFIGKFAVIR
jgi:hypothetical protein